MTAGLFFGLVAQLAGEIGEQVQGGIDADQGELGLDDLQVEMPDVGQDAAHPSGRVVPFLAGGSGPVVAAVHGHEHGGLAGQDGLGAGGHARVGDDHVGPGLEVLRHPEVVERGGEQQRVGRDELVGQGRGERQRTLLLVRA